MNIYDFDKTIYINDSSVDFFKYCLKRNKKMFLLLPKMFFALILYLLKIIEKEQMKSTFFSFIKYFDDIEKTALEFWEYKNYKLKDYYINQRNKKDIIVSASPEFLLKPVAKKYGFKLIGTIHDLKTGKIIGNNCYGKEKVERLKKEGITDCENFYSDSLSDTPASKIAKHSYIVKGESLIPWHEYKPSLISRIKHTFLNRDFITFIAIGLINTINGIWISYVYSLFIQNAVIAFGLGFVTSLCISYILNSILNFKQKLEIKKFIKFAASNIPNFIIQMITVFILIELLDWTKLISYAISAVISVPITFILIKLNVFKEENKM